MNAGHQYSAAASLGSLATLPVVPALEFLHWDPGRPAKHHTPVPGPVVVPDNAKARGTPTTIDRSDLGEAELRYLRAVVDHPGRPSSEYPRLARLGRDRAAAIRQRLAEAGYVRLHEVATGPKGRHAIVVEPLEAAQSVLGRAHRGPA